MDILMIDLDLGWDPNSGIYDTIGIIRKGSNFVFFPAVYNTATFLNQNSEVVWHPHLEVPYPHLKRGQQTLGTLVAVVRSNRYINNDLG